MAKKKDITPEKLRETAREKLHDLGYEDVIENFQLYDPLGDGTMKAVADLAAFDEKEPVILFSPAE